MRPAVRIAVAPPRDTAVCDVHTVYLRPAVPPDPCAAGCPDPAAHAEGGHDV